MTPVILESPYAAHTRAGIARNLTYARACLRDCLFRGESPYASHALLTQPGVLDDTVPEERALGIEAGLVWKDLGVKTVVYVDHGITDGMRLGIARALGLGHEVEYRRLSKELP